MADSIVPATEYANLKAYSNKLHQKSQQTVVLKSAGNPAGN
jgi:hypothetical protein